MGSSGCGAPRVRKELPPVCDRQATSEGKGGGGRAAQRCVQIPASLAVGPWANALISLNLRFFSSQKPKLRREGGARKAPRRLSRKPEWWEAVPPPPRPAASLHPLHWSTWLLVGPVVWV